MNFVYNDGGRSNYFKATGVGDCAVRAIAIAAELDYKKVYDDLKELNFGRSCRNGTPKTVDSKYLKRLGWVKLKNICGIGVGIRYHLNDYDLKPFFKKYPRMVLQVSKHLTAIVNGELNDTYDCSRDGERAIYAIWVPKDQVAEEDSVTVKKKRRFVL